MPEPIEAITDATVNRTPAAPAIPHAASTAPVTDTAILSETAQVTVLLGKGESIAEIASTLGLTVSEVNSDLGIVAPPTQPQAATEPALPSATEPRT